MSARNSYLRYGAVAMTLHWLIALFILGNIASGFYFNEIMDHHDAARFGVVQLHKSIGLTVLLLSLARLAWRLVNPVPKLPPDMSPAMKGFAHLTHYLLYFLMIAVPLLGWLVASASRTGVPTLYFGVIPWPNIGLIADLPRAQKIADGHIFSALHIWLAYAMLVLALGHIAAALYHHFLRRDTVLRRMVPGTQVGRDGDTIVGAATP